MAISGCDDSRTEPRLLDFLQGKREGSLSTGSCSGSSVRLASDPFFLRANQRLGDLIETLIVFFSSLLISPFKVGLVGGDTKNGTEHTTHVAKGNTELLPGPPVLSAVDLRDYLFELI